jgi:alpha-1,6-mannosyltransferase
MKALMGNKSILFAGSFLLLCLGYYNIGYLIHRNQTELLLISYAGLCLLSWPWMRPMQASEVGASTSWKNDLFAGLFFRVLLIFSWPNLSQDVYRFLWDGALFSQGVSPYLYTPNTLIPQQELLGIQIPYAGELFSAMGSLSAGNFSNYPPIKQLIFALPHWLGIQGILGQIWVLRFVIILADVGVFFLGRRILTYRSLNPKLINWYFLNPLIILELSGNCHFEGLLALSILASLMWLIQKKYLLSGIGIGIGIGLKLIPLILVPVIGAFIARGLKKSQTMRPIGLFTAGIIGTLGLIFLPMLNTETLGHFTSTTSLWFTKFEFNASIYYVLRWIGFQWKGYNLIAQIGPALSIITLIGTLYLSYRVWTEKSNMYQAMMGSILIYLLLATTVHPWYWTTVLILSVFTKSRIGLMGSMLIFLSYSAYRDEIVQESTLWLSLEYLILIAYVLWELKNSKVQKDQCAKTSSS